MATFWLGPLPMYLTLYDYILLTVCFSLQYMDDMENDDEYEETSDGIHFC